MKLSYPKSLSRFNTLLWQLLITPIATLLYAPVNRFIMLPRLGSGEPYTDLDGTLVTDYFSANSMALIVMYVLFFITMILSVYNTRSVKGWKRVLLLLLCFLMSLVTSLFFLEFTLWTYR